MVQAAGLVLDPGWLGLFRGCPEHDRRLAESPLQEDKGGGEHLALALALALADGAFPDGQQRTMAVRTGPSVLILNVVTSVVKYGSCSQRHI